MDRSLKNMAVHDDDNDKSLFLFFARYIYIKKIQV